jgi:hypothetical protein
MKTETMPAGRELDALVAEKVMGWGWMTHDQPQVLPRRRWLVPPEEVGDWGHVHPASLDLPPEEPWWLTGEPSPPADMQVVPHYSADWTGAALVIGRLIAGSLDTFGLHCMDGRWVASFRLADRGRDPYDDAEGRGEASTAPHAICRAALAALEQTR